MFAMLGGAAGAWGSLAEVLAVQAASGLEVVTDGRETLPAGPEAARLADDLTAGRGIGSVEVWSAAVAAALGATPAAVGASAPGPAAAAATPPPAVAVAAALPGPYSLARRAGGIAAGEAPDPTLVRALGSALALEARSLAAAGCTLARIDEPDASAAGAGDADRAAFAAAHRALVAGAGAGADGVVPAIHRMLALTGGDHGRIGAATLGDLGYASYLFDLIAGPTDWRLIAALPGDRGIVCGVVDPLTDVGDAPEVLVWAAHYAASIRGRGLARVGLATTGSLAGLDRVAATAKMRALGEGARIAALPADEIRTTLDPRAIDMRSAALGAWSADPRLPRGRRV